MNRTLKLLSLACLALTTPANADMLDDILDVTVRPGWRADNGSHIAAIQFDLAPGWKTYWRQPGDAGIPPVFNWSGSKNLESAALIWPLPSVSWDQGLRSVGYEGRFVLPVVFQTRRSGQIDMQANIQIGVCADVCIPVQLNLAANLPAQGSRDGIITAAIASQPKRGQGKIVCTFTPSNDGMSVEMTLPKPKGGASAAAIEIDVPGLWISEPIITDQGRDLQLTADIVTPSGQPMGINRSAVITTVFAGSTGVEYRGCVGG